jgi:hypothetical protein
MSWPKTGAGAAKRVISIRNAFLHAGQRESGYALCIKTSFLEPKHLPRLPSGSGKCNPPRGLSNDSLQLLIEGLKPLIFANPTRPRPGKKAGPRIPLRPCLLVTFFLTGRQSLGLTGG